MLWGVSPSGQAALPRADGLGGVHGLSSSVLCLNLPPCHLSTLRTAPSIFTCGQCTGLQNVFQTDFPEWLSRTDSNSVDLLCGEGHGTPLQYSCLENPMDGGAVHGVTKSQARLSDFTFTFHFYALEKEMATHSSVLAWRIPGTGEPGGLPSMGSHRVRHD